MPFIVIHKISEKDNVINNNADIGNIKATGIYVFYMPKRYTLCVYEVYRMKITNYQLNLIKNKDMTKSLRISQKTYSEKYVSPLYFNLHCLPPKCYSIM